MTGRQWGPPQEVRAIADDEVATQEELAYSSLELGLDDAVEHFRRLVALKPDDTTALLNLAHAVYAAGDANEAAELLTRVVDGDPGNVDALRVLVDIHRRTGRTEAALDCATGVAESDPDDVLAAFEVAELSLACGAYDRARAAFARVRDIDPEEEHRPFAYHGMIDAEIRRQRWRPALDLAIDATQEDRNSLTTALLAYIATQLFGPGEEPAPTTEAIEEALAAERDAYRRLLVEARAI